MPKNVQESNESGVKPPHSKIAFLKLLYRRINDHALLARSAQLSYYFLLAMFPLLVFLVTLLGYFAQAGSRLRSSLLHYLGTVMPYSAITLVRATLDEISESRGGGKLSFSLLAALWVASSGMAAIGDTLNVAYDVKETRAWWRRRLTSILLTMGLTILIVSALLIVLYGGELGEKLAFALGHGAAFETTWAIIQWPIMLLFVFLTFALTYYFAPNLPRRGWSLATHSVTVAVALWLLISFSLRFYLHFFNSYSRTYGSTWRPDRSDALVLSDRFGGTAGRRINSMIEGARLVRDEQ